MIYYTETNLIAIVVGIVLLIQSKRISSRNETSQIIMNKMLYLLIILSVCDIAAYYFRGKNYFWIELSNMIYFLAMAIGTYAWFIYICVKTGNLGARKIVMTPASIPILILCVAFIFNPVSGMFFSVDDQLLYHRGPGIIITWIIEWGYLFAAIGMNIKAVLNEKRSFRKKEYRGYLLYAVPMAVTAVTQMLFYGTTTLQIGYMLALLLAYLNKQYYQIHRDELTGLNNQNAFMNYQDSLFAKSEETELTLFMIDADEFKAINDTYGHLKGDQALRDIADILKLSSAGIDHGRMILFRYGGDEFIIIGKNMKSEDTEHFRTIVSDNLRFINEENARKGEKYQLSVSIGIATRNCANQEDFSTLLKEADEAMYQVKKSKK